MSHEVTDVLNDHIDSIESAYEFMLAYAAQGRDGRGTDYVAQARQFMNGMVAALELIAEDAIECLKGADGNLVDYQQDFVDVLSEDARKSSIVVNFVLKQDRITSQLVDNVNASIHLRALLTDIFLLDEMLKTNAIRSI